MLKTSGYLVSTLSVLLLGVISWQSASEKPLMLVLLILGMASSVGGMFLRWLSFVNDREDKKSVDPLARRSGAKGLAPARKDLEREARVKEIRSV